MANTLLEFVLASLTFLSFLVVGVLIIRYPYQFAKFKEQVHAIGSKRSIEDVEPANWYVSVVRFGGVIFVLCGVAGLIAISWVLLAN